VTISPAFLLTTAVVLTASCVSMAFAQGRSTGQTIEYEVAQTSTNKTDFSNLPGSTRARAEQNQAFANGKKTTTNVTMTVDSVDADGNAHVNAKYTQYMEGISGAAAGVLSSAHEFQGTFTADGRFLPTFDPNAAPTMDSHGRYTAANAPNMNGQTMQGTFADFNTFITGASKRSKLKAGDIWSLTVKDAIGISRQYEFAVVQLDPSNSSVALISMKNEVAGESSSQKINANGHYDSARRILTTYHEENAYSSSMPTGMTSSGVTMMDIELRK
jgi:hypothetical protein